MSEKQNLTPRQQLKAIFKVAGLSVEIAPGAVAFKLAGAVIDAVVPIVTTYFAAQTINALTRAYQGDSEAEKQALIYIAITAALSLLMITWRSVDNYIQAKLRYLVEARVSDRMYSHFLSLDYWRYNDKDTADLYDRALKFSNFYAYVFDRIAVIVSQLIGVITAVVALALFHPVLALVVFIALTPGVYVQFKLSRMQIQHWNENVEVRRAKSMLEWHLGKPDLIPEIRLYGMVNFLLKHRKNLRDKDEKERIDFEKKFLPLRLFSDGLESLVEIGSLVWVALQIVDKQQPIGQFVYVQQIVYRAMSSASSLVSTLGSIDEDIANLFDYQQFMSLPTSQTGTKTLAAPPQKITLNKVSFHYPASDKLALKDVSFEIERNTHIAIVGENGAGKTTLIKLLTGQYQPSSGEILLDATNLSDVNDKNWHKQFAVLQQGFIHYEFATAGDNVRFGAVDEEHTAERLKNALNQAEAEGFTAKLPVGLGTYVNTWMEDKKGNKGVDLSGGQWQRLALARNFYRNAPIIILDEPTSAIDALAEARIFKRLFADKNRTVITISHRLSTVERADIIFMLEDGGLVESGTHQELVKKKGRYFRMFESQLKDH